MSTRAWRGPVFDSIDREFVYLQRGLVVPRAAVDLALGLESRGLRLSADGDDLLVDGDGLTPADIANLQRFKDHVLLVVRYVADDSHLRDPNRQPPAVGPLVVPRKPSRSVA
jgi:hypothetical protein